MTVEIDFIKSLPYFSGLSNGELDDVKKYIFEKTVPRSEMVQNEGEPAGVLCFVVSGVVKIFKTSAEGKEQILELMRPGDSFNDVAVLSESANLAGAQAMSPVTLYLIKKDELKTIIREHPQVSLNIIQVLSRRIQHLISLVEDLSFRPVTGRVAKILLEHAENSTPRLTQQDMAAMAGTVREMVGRSLKSLEEDGIIKLERNRIVITDRKALREMAESGTSDKGRRQLDR